MQKTVFTDWRGGPDRIRGIHIGIGGPDAGLGTGLRAVLAGGRLTQRRPGPGAGTGVHLLQLRQLLAVLDGVDHIPNQEKCADEKNDG